MKQPSAKETASTYPVRVDDATFRRLKRIKKATHIPLGHIVTVSVAAYEQSLIGKGQISS